jgi:hypothetical protein
MELENTIFQVSNVDVKDCKFPRLTKTMALTVDIPIARNRRAIEKGEVLCLPFFEK